MTGPEPKKATSEVAFSVSDFVAEALQIESFETKTADTAFVLKYAFALNASSTE